MDVTTVDSLNIERYMGRWYEIARLPHPQERGLHSITATYALKEDGTVSVANSGYRQDGLLKKAHGKAYRPDEKAPGRLKVSFFWFFYGDYLVIELDPNYQWAMVSSSGGKNLWILSRTPYMERTLYEELLERARKRGFDLSELVVVEQKVLD